MSRLPGEAVRGGHRGGDLVPGHLPDTVQHKVCHHVSDADQRLMFFFSINLFKKAHFNKDLMGG